MIRLITISFLLCLFLWGCASDKQLQSRKVMRNDIEMLYGKIDREQLYFDYPFWKSEAAYYQPDSAIVEQLKQTGSADEALVFLATWCGDSEVQAPAFFEVFDRAGLDKQMEITMWAVDRKLKLDNGLAQSYQIERVPTFIFLKDGKEIGRIVETPIHSMEADMLNILRKQSR